MRKLGFFILVFSVFTSCAPKVGVKPGATQDDFSRDRYACMQESQQRVSGAMVNPYGEMASSNVQTNPQLFNACMNARGWYLQEKEQ